MRAPSTNVPDVVVLDSVDADEKPKVVMNLKKDLWLSTVDGYVVLDSYSHVRAHYSAVTFAQVLIHELLN